MKLSELPPPKQNIVMRAVMKGEEEVFYQGEKVEIPRLISVRYSCASCGRLVMPSFHIEDVRNVVRTIRCTCGGYMNIYLVGVELDGEIKKVRGKIQTKLSDFFGST